MSRLFAIVVATVTIMITAAVTSALWGLVILPEARYADPTTSSVKNYVPFTDGVDPMLTVCREDAVVASATKRLNDQFLVEMLYSTQCMAAWGRVTRYDDQSAGNSLKMIVYPEVQMNSPRTQERSAVNLQSIYTTLMIEPDVDARVCGLAIVTVNDGVEKTLGTALCV